MTKENICINCTYWHAEFGQIEGDKFDFLTSISDEAVIYGKYRAPYSLEQSFDKGTLSIEKCTSFGKNGEQLFQEVELG